MCELYLNGPWGSALARRLSFGKVKRPGSMGAPPVFAHTLCTHRECTRDRNARVKLLG